MPCFAPRVALATWAVVLLAAAGCSREAEGVPKADVELLGKKLQLIVEAVPLETLVVTLKRFPDLEKAVGATRRLSALTPEEEAALFAEWDRIRAQLDKKPWNWDQPLSPEERRIETGAVEVMRSSMAKMRAILLPHRAWVEENFGKEVFEDTETEETGDPR